MSLTRSRALRPREIYAPMAVLLMAVLFLFAGLALAAPGPDQDRFIVKFQDGKGPRGKAALRRAGAELLVELGPQNAAAFRIPAQALAGIAQNPNIEYIEADAPRYPMAEVVPYGITMVQAEFGVNGGIAAGSFVPKVCIIDSGIDGLHEDLPGALGGDPGDFASDSCGHGSHVAGTIAAVTNQTGVVGVMGDPRTVELIILKVFDGPSCGYSYASSVASAANKCADLGADIINMSLGCTGRRCSSRTEQAVFDSLYGQGVLSIAAAGNDGNTQYSYPASYDSVVSVAAIDEASVLATFSQRNNQVELAAPGVGVLSTVPMGTGLIAAVSANDAGYAAAGMDGSPNGNVTGSIVDCGFGESPCPGAAGAICLISRGNISFSDKVLACQYGGGIAAVIYNNEPGMLYGTLGGVATTIPSVGISDVDGATILGAVNAGGATGSVELGTGNYDTYNGTSMATPHVAGVAALVWSHVPDAGAAGIRQALQATAIDLGATGRDSSFGYGLVQAAEAVAYLGGGSGGGGGGGGGGNAAPTASFSFSCTDLACDFDATNSDDTDGSISSYAWGFGDGGTGSGITASHTYSGGGTYTVTLTVTDNAGATDSASESVSVTDPNAGGGDGITLSALGYKVKGAHTVDLTWSGATSDNVDIKRGSTTITTANDGAYTDNIGAKGGGSYTYQVCEAGTTTCSAVVNVTF